ncbi:FAS-associated death domain protein-like isoform X2 [Hippocampus comes]|uniref:FAS-associated death domain protein-like isoform X2 n=1 Tax=Hippocampus comes TaxID=109280 RepID=UPI00094E1744|nr:PREDICTED: FAS-associated death domain protein-like isoform X2 [Hippocampus comes]XP_019713382.1 PREDICTED: FAS-associated death domain protein-like isoform X2 [Hippocampus comes]
MDWSCVRDRYTEVKVKLDSGRQFQRNLRVQAMASLRFNALLLDISSQLTTEQLDRLKYLCGDKVGKRELETIDNGIKLFQCLTERGVLNQDKTELLSELLTLINRQDLEEKLSSFQSPPECAGTQLCETERAKLEIATKVIAENVGGTWRKLGRELGLSETKLKSISMRFPTDLEETVRELLKEWRKSRGAEARTGELIEALRACQQNLTADIVEAACI